MERKKYENLSTVSMKKLVNKLRALGGRSISFKEVSEEKWTVRAQGEGLPKRYGWKPPKKQSEPLTFIRKQVQKMKECEAWCYSAPSDKMCCICSQELTDKVKEDRPTGPKASIQTWYYCPACYEFCKGGEKLCRSYFSRKTVSTKY